MEIQVTDEMRKNTLELVSSLKAQLATIGDDLSSFQELEKSTRLRVNAAGIDEFSSTMIGMVGVGVQSFLADISEMLGKEEVFKRIDTTTNVIDIAMAVASYHRFLEKLNEARALMKAENMRLSMLLQSIDAVGRCRVNNTVH